MNHSKSRKFVFIYALLTLLLFQSCSTFKYRTYDEEANVNVEDPEPAYDVTLDPNFQDFTTYMFLGNRIENFSTYFNTYFNATENFDEAYEDYATRVLSVYSERLDSVFIKPPLSQQASDQFNNAIEKASKIVQLHKSSKFMDRSVMLIGKSYYYLGDYLKAERKFSEFFSKLPASTLYDEAILFLARTQLRLDKIKSATEKLDQLIARSKSSDILSGAYQSKAEYFIYVKDYENGIRNFKQAIKYSTDNEFRAQMQFIVAAVTERTNIQQAVNEYRKVMDYGVSFDLEYYAKYNYAKTLIATGQFGRASEEIDDLEVKYKDLPVYLGEISYLKATYYEQKKEIHRALDQYYYVMQNYPSTKPSADASYRVGAYEENAKRDFLSAFRFYRYSTEQSNAGSYFNTAGTKARIFKRYFELKSVITGRTINTDYDSVFQSKVSIAPLEKQNEEFEGPGKDMGKPGGRADSIPDRLSEDSLMLNLQKKAQAKYELAELFLYDLNMADSGEFYLKDAFESSDEYEFKAKVLFALANLYANTDNKPASDETLHRILQDYPASSVTAPSKRLLNIYVDEVEVSDGTDSLYMQSERKFLDRDYAGALAGFNDIIVNHSTSKYLEKSLYGSGWIYENVFLKADSAYHFYSALLKTSPKSELANIVVPKIEEYELLMNGGIDTNESNTNDSLKQNEIKKEEIQPQQNEGKDGEGTDKKQDEVDPSMLKEDKSEGEGTTK